MGELEVECEVGNPAKVRAAEPRKQEHDRRDATLILNHHLPSLVERLEALINCLPNGGEVDGRSTTQVSPSGA